MAHTARWRSETLGTDNDGSYIDRVARRTLNAIDELDPDRGRLAAEAVRERGERNREDLDLDDHIADRQHVHDRQELHRRTELHLHRSSRYRSGWLPDRRHLGLAELPSYERPSQTKSGYGHRPQACRCIGPSVHRCTLRILNRIRSDQSGVTLIEVLISAMVLMIVSAGLFMALTAGNRATATERHRAKANDLAEQELERVRSLRIGDLSSWNSTRRVIEDGTELASGASCPASRTDLLHGHLQHPVPHRDGLDQHLRLGHRIPRLPPALGLGELDRHGRAREPVTAGTVISPPNGSLVPNSGSLLVQVDDSNSNGISGVTLTGSGPGLVHAGPPGPPGASSGGTSRRATTR